MTRLLDEALSQLSKLPASEQDAVAAIVLEELASETRWADSFAKSQDLLAELAVMNPSQIVSDPAIMMGKPVVAGTRITVELILENSPPESRSNRSSMRTRSSRARPYWPPSILPVQRSARMSSIPYPSAPREPTSSGGWRRIWAPGERRGDGFFASLKF